jgi:hypothetical protein
MRRRQVLMRWLMVVVLLSVWPGGIAVAAHPNGRPDLPHPIIPCTPAELPDQAVPIESCSPEDPGTAPDSSTTTTVPDSTTTTTVPDQSTTTTVPDSTTTTVPDQSTTTTVPDPTTATTVPDQSAPPTTTTTTSVPGQPAPTTTVPGPTTTTTVPVEPPTPDQPQDQTQLQPAHPGGSDAGTIPCVPPEMPDEAVPDTCPPSDQEDLEEPIGSDGLERSPNPSAEPGPQDPPPGPTVTDPNTGSGGGGEDSGDSGQVPAADDSGSGSATPPLDQPAPDFSTPAEPATPASPSPGGPATPAEPATPPEPVQPIGFSTEADSPSTPSASVQIEPPVPLQGPDLVEVERVGELLAFLQPDALPDLAGFGAQDGATGSGWRPPEPELEAGLDLVLPPQLQTSRASVQAAGELVAQAVQQLLRSLALPLAAVGLLAVGLLQGGGLSTVKKSRVRR